ncbi:MAG: response regulator [Alphaproteobacteria bacterium]
MPTQAAYDFKELRVLLLDDNPHMLRLLVTMLRGLGVTRIDSHQDPETAIEPAYLDNADIIISDWLLQTTSSMEFARRVRARQPDPICFVPIIQLSGFTQRADVELSRDAGITEFLSLPVSPKLLYERIVHAIEKPRPFIDSPNYFGPDRRRRSDEQYVGENRRLLVPNVVDLTGEEGPMPKLENTA